MPDSNGDCRCTRDRLTRRSSQLSGSVDGFTSLATLGTSSSSSAGLSSSPLCEWEGRRAVGEPVPLQLARCFFCPTETTCDRSAASSKGSNAMPIGMCVRPEIQARIWALVLDDGHACIHDRGRWRLKTCLAALRAQLIDEQLSQHGLLRPQRLRGPPRGARRVTRCFLHLPGLPGPFWFPVAPREDPAQSWM